MGSNPIQVANIIINLRCDFVLSPPLRRRVLRTHLVRLEDFKSDDLKPCKGLGSNPIQVANNIVIIRFRAYYNIVIG